MHFELHQHGGLVQTMNKFMKSWMRLLAGTLCVDMPAECFFKPYVADPAQELIVAHLMSTQASHAVGA